MTADAATFPAIVALADAAGVPPEWFLAIFSLESNLSANPPGNQNFAGVSQMSVDKLAAYNVTPDEYRQWPVSKQITDVVTPWYLGVIKGANLGRPMATIGALYALNLAPSTVAAQGDADDVVLYSAGSAAYTQNAPLDYDHSNTITIGDLTEFLTTVVMARPPYTTALPSLIAAEGAIAAPSASSSGGGGLAVVGAAIAIGAAVFLSRR